LVVPAELLGHVGEQVGLERRLAGLLVELDDGLLVVLAVVDMAEAICWICASAVRRARDGRVHVPARRRLGPGRRQQHLGDALPVLRQDRLADEVLDRLAL